jgi:hypothetical protein
MEIAEEKTQIIIFGRYAEERRGGSYSVYLIGGVRGRA